MSLILTPFSNLDPEIPGKVYLCQVRPGVSCGACCGLYNVSDASRPAIYDMLLKRTELFASVKRKYEDVLAFADKIALIENQRRPIDDFHHCPYIGFMNSDPLSPGCLLHPMASGNNGLDLRGVSYYGGMTCNMYFCPTCRDIPERYKKILRYAADDWHSFGLLITESDVIKCFFENVETDLGRLLEPDEMNFSDEFFEAVRGFINLKTDWPFRKNGILVNYFFNDGIGAAPDIQDKYGLVNRWNPVLKAFRSEISCVKDFDRAVDLLEKTAANLSRNI